ncbi:MAG: RNase adaptor protein RapZ, partial [Ruminococcus sp.]|nr:RNase adaptor protein RapZ [Ruminococcus sp.]
MQFVVVTGISGSGKSTAIDVLEDIGYYCIDNMPPELMVKFADICVQSEGNFDKVAFVADVRGGALFFKLKDAITDMRNMGIKVKVIFLDCSDEVIMRRYKETRRRHPLYEIANGNIR